MPLSIFILSNICWILIFEAFDISKKDFLNLVSNIEYLQENQKDEIIETIDESSENIQNFENFDKNIEANGI